ncbi:MAG: hypothetical protein AB7F94_19080 [Nitrospira sp.]
MTKTVKGKIHGTTIELEEPVLLPDGTKIEIQIRVDRLSHLEQAFGGWRDDPKLDQAFDQIDHDRHETRISLS